MEPVSTLLYSFILVLARPFGFVSSFFFIGGELVPTWPRRGLILAFALPVFPIVFDAAPNIAAQDFLWLTILQEFALGWLIGWPVMGVGVAWSSAGFLIDNQRGSSLAGQFDPGLATESSPLSNFLNLAWIVILVQGGLFQALAQLLYSSYGLAPVGEVSKIVLMERMHEFIMVFAAITKAAFLLASPAIITMAAIELSMGFLGRSVQRIDVFFLAMPIKSLVALIILIAQLRFLTSEGYPDWLWRLPGGLVSPDWLSSF